MKQKPYASILLNLRRPARNYCLLLDDFAKNYRAQRQSFNDLWLPMHGLFSLRLLQVFFAR